MSLPRQSGTYVVVTIVTLLIWILAAAKTRQVETVAGRLDFTVASDSAGDRFQVSPDQIPVTVMLEGPAIAVREARGLLTSAPLTVPLPAEHGRQEIDDLADRIQALDAMRDTGVSILSVEPPRFSVDVTEFVTRTAVTRADIQTTSTVQDVSIAPTEVSVTVPRSLVHELPDRLVVDAIVDPRDVLRLEPGVLHTVDGALQLPDSVRVGGSATIDPPTARVSFQLVARQRRATVPKVRVQVVSSPEDFGLYHVELASPLLADVDIEASPDAIAEVEAGKAQVIAVVHLSTRDKERQLEQKAVSFFAIVRTSGEATPIAGSLKDDPHPMVDLVIRSVE
ncbi:MAG: hypothetical protein QF733_08095 [Phycisphaerales bacterium]|jgi:hypothetical protein|nr:hypothetical protein [Phycisphaerales bacterium]